ncbi:ommochrome-binding protein-like [Aricia agestis]|uniref:ommochrome-binding protein-like n=1 Tax=Aricia agestis TaxID=91739 RepID=UPI001C201F75|nr:ommochrome-binding protein-like [Aricia agestis]
MKTLKKIVLLLLATTNFALQEETKCVQITIDGVNYVQELLKDNVDKPYNLVIDKEKDIVYFSYGVDIEKDEFNAAYINLVTKDFATIAGVNNGFTQAVNKKTHEVYIGGRDGIYKYKVGGKAELIAEKGTNIWYVYFDDILYFSTFPSQFLYTYDGEVKRFSELENTNVDLFVLDGEDIYFVNREGLKKKAKDDDIELIEEFAENYPRCLIENDGEIYLCIKDSVYKLKKQEQTLEKLFNITDNMYGLAIDDDDNIIYSDSSNVYRLNKDKAC